LVGEVDKEVKEGVNDVVDKEVKVVDQVEKVVDKGEKEEKVVDTSLGITGKLSVEEIGLPTRVANALSKAGYETVEELFAAKKEDLAKVRNLGKKSLKIIKAALGQKGVTWEVI